MPADGWGQLLPGPALYRRDRVLVQNAMRSGRLLSAQRNRRLWMCGRKEGGRDRDPAASDLDDFHPEKSLVDRRTFLQKAGLGLVATGAALGGFGSACAREAQKKLA